jgi:hypothetical protein
LHRNSLKGISNVILKLPWQVVISEGFAGQVVEVVISQGTSTSSRPLHVQRITHLSPVEQK